MCLSNRVEETMNLRYLEEKPNVQGLGYEWNHKKLHLTARYTKMLIQTQKFDEQFIFPSYPSHSILEAEPKDTSGDEVDVLLLILLKKFLTGACKVKGQEQRATSDAKDAEELPKRAIPTSGVPVPTGSPTDSFFNDKPTTRFPSPSDLGNNEPSLGIFFSSSYDDEFGADLKNLASTVEVSHVETKRINTIHPQSLIIGDHTLAVQMRSKVNKTTTGESAFISYIHDQQRDNHTDFQHCKYAIGTKWILKNKRDARGIVVRNKARLVAQGHRQEEGIDYDEIFALVARIEAIRLFLAFASYMGFMVYQMDVNSAFLYEELMRKYMSLNLKDLWILNPKKVYKVGQALYGLYQEKITKGVRVIILVQVYVETSIFGIYIRRPGVRKLSLDEGEFEMSAMGELTFFLGLQSSDKTNGLFISQASMTATTPYEAPKPKSKNKPDSPVNDWQRNIPPASPQPFPTGKPKVPAPVPTSRQNRPFPVPIDRGYSPSVTSGWWKSTARPMPHLNRPTSSYFQTYTPYVPQMYYNHMKYGGLRWATAVKPSAGCSWKTHRKGLYWENPYSDAEDEGIFDSGCSRSMTGNMERLDDFQEFQGGFESKGRTVVLMERMLKHKLEIDKDVVGNDMTTAEQLIRFIKNQIAAA
ncbi:putative ribonuclease H-like domain-containing protein [Tanacetum coccineum]